jgi:D-sedoheptulose 7-phosphate isomerase
MLHEPRIHEAIHEAAQKISAAFKAGGKVYACGNGGSMCDALHFAEELSGRFRKDRPPLAAMAIGDSAHISCVANDYGYEEVFSRFLQAHGRKGDVLLGISTSGQSVNVIKAAQTAHSLGMEVIVLTGHTPRPLTAWAHTEICTPGFTPYADRVQELHIKVIHILVELCEGYCFSSCL